MGGIYGFEGENENESNVSDHVSPVVKNSKNMYQPFTPLNQYVYSSYCSHGADNKNFFNF